MVRVVAALVLLLAAISPARGEEVDKALVEKRTRLRELNARVQELGRQHEYKLAGPLAEEALALAVEVHGELDPQTAACRMSLARLHTVFGRYGEALVHFERAREALRASLGEGHVDTLSCETEIGFLHQDLGDLAKARAIMEAVVVRSLRAHGRYDAATSTAMANLASIMMAQGENSTALFLFEEAIAASEKVLGTDAPDLIHSLGNLAALHQRLGNSRVARPLRERALQIALSNFGEDAPEVLAARKRLGRLLVRAGELAAARPHLERAADLCEKLWGPNSVETATSICELAHVVKDMGDFAAAKSLYERALAIRAGALGEEHPETATYLRFLASLMAESGDPPSAKPLAERAAQVLERTLGPDDPQTLGALGDLAEIYQDLGDLERARAVIERVLVSLEKAPPSVERLRWSAPNNLGMLHVARHDLAAARPPLEQALGVAERMYGRDHPLTALTANNLAWVLIESGCVDAARPLARRAWEVNRETVHAFLRDQSSTERIATLRTWMPQLTCYLRAFVDEPETTYAAATAWKGAALRMTAASLQLPPEAGVEARAAWEELAAKRDVLSRLVLSQSHSPSADEDYSGQVRSLLARIASLERKLAGWHPDLAARAFLQVLPADVQAALPDGTSLLEVLDDGTYVHSWVVRRDLAIKYFYLGRSGAVGQAAERFREALETDDLNRWESDGGVLRAVMADALTFALEDADALAIAADGALATIPWSLLPDGDPSARAFLLERITVSMVTSGAGLVCESRFPSREKGVGLLVVGDVDYDAAEGALDPARRVERPWPRLAETRFEAVEVARRFRERFPDVACNALLGDQATESAFKRLAPGVRFVHAATHGYFRWEDPTGPVGRAGLRGVMGGRIGAPLPGETDPSASGAGRVSAPLLRTGLVLAGANAGRDPGGEDGWLTAEEIQAIDLRDVELVVMSACETARGEVAAGEGVLGLGRALSVAGARRFVLSLWKVPDRETRELMSAFYDGLWGEASIDEASALRRAQLAMLAHDRASGQVRPSAWGAWISMR